jgi:hypothetical protein
MLTFLFQIRAREFSTTGNSATFGGQGLLVYVHNWEQTKEAVWVLLQGFN